MKFRNKLFYFITAIEIIAVLCSGKYFYDKKISERKVLGEMKIAVIDKDKVNSNPQDDLQYFWEYKPDEYVKDNPDWLGYKVVYKINSDSLNERFDYDVEKKTGIFRIITLGDSFTFGLYVNTGNNWPEILEDKLNKEIKNDKISKFEVINLGMGGYDVQYSVKRYKMRGLKYNPDMILWFESGDSYSRFRELMTPIINECEDNLIEKKQEVKVFKKKDLDYCWDKSKETIEEKYGEKKLYGLLGTYWEEFLELKEKDVNFVYFGYFTTDYKSFMTKLFSGCKNCYLHDDVSDIDSLGGNLFDGHPNEKGHKIMAEEIFDYLIDNKLIN